MRLTEKEFAKLIESNPHLAGNLPKLKAANKYKNTKLYEFEDGFVSEEKQLKNHGKIIATYDSIKEFNRWNELLIEFRKGLITDLSRQEELLIQEAFTYTDAKGNKIKVNKIVYKADFFYHRDGYVFVEDVKAFDNKTGRYILTKDFRLKWKLLMFKYPDYKFVIY